MLDPQHPHHETENIKKPWEMRRSLLTMGSAGSIGGSCPSLPRSGQLQGALVAPDSPSPSLQAVQEHSIPGCACQEQECRP